MFNVFTVYITSSFARMLESHHTRMTRVLLFC